MITLLVFLFILGLLIIAHEFGHFIVAKRMGVKVEKFSLGFGPVILKKKKKDTEYSLSAIPLGGYVKLAGDSLEEFKGRSFEYFAQPPGRRFWIIFFGPLFNYVLGFLFFWLVFFAGYPTLTTRVGGLVDGFGAKEAGVKAGDKIIAVDAQPVEFWEDLQDVIQDKKEAQKVALSVLRDNKVYTLTANIREKKIDDLLGQKRSVGLLGITASDEVVKVRHGFFASFLLGLDKTWNLTVLTYQALFKMVTGKLSIRQSVTGPLGIFYITSKATSVGIIAVLQLIAVLSLSLSIFNLLPLPVLDGGHILLLGLEKIRGKTLSAKTERVVTRAGLSLIAALAILVSYNDIVRFFGDKIARGFK